LAPHHPQALSKLRESVVRFSEISRKHAFGFAAPCTWGSLYVNLSAGSAAWLFYRLSGVGAYSELTQNVRDFTLGKNPWGISFINGWGDVYPTHLHHNIFVYLDAAGRQVEAAAAMRGAVAEGPVYRREWEKEFGRKAPSGKGTPGLLQPERCVYYDYFNDYMTNEPCIYGVAEAILFYSLVQSPRSLAPSPRQERVEPSRAIP
jgi:hypothetical protein